ncbi:fatty acid desaturase [Amycolatopsis lexingtonensis]|uniref:Fatty acid desaturase n=1 Tax=Amycolatopsis lexingtonensis TaxID=218822 RepID=A0ABR9HT28_9PSEU|nr:acyl-CoA desaturase [Amycolatopsis lexingtonensis]MBE1494076.1 fatty acid desaturase [Amycolatopsis lexingtonensis]
MDSVASSTQRESGPRQGSEYAELPDIIKEAGLLRRRPVRYAVKGSLTLLAFTGAWVAFALLGDTWWQLFTAAFLAVACTQIAFLGHDAGHKQIFPRRRANAALAFTSRQSRAKRGFPGWMAKYQAFRWVEATLLATHIVGYLTAVFLVLSPGKALVFIAVHQGLWGLYMGCSFAPNHKGMLTLTEGHPLDFLREQVLTSHNVTGGRWVDFAFGGLNFQIEHHLFPGMPRPTLRRAQPLVQAFCVSRGINYSEGGLLVSYGQILRYLHEVGAPLRADDARKKGRAASQ